MKLRSIGRQQTVLAQIYVEELIPADHKARALWDLVGRMDLSRFTESLRTTAGCAGRPAWDPQLMVSLWIYAYSEGISSAREIERLMEWEPGIQWLGELQAVNHHSLSDFRIEHRAALDELFAQLLALLAQGSLSQVTSLNRELQVLRRMFHLAQEWGRVERALPNVKMLPGEKHRERVLTAAEEDLYLRGASTDAMAQYADAALLRDVATILLDCGLRPEECFRLRTENVTDGNLETHCGKTDNAPRRIPMTPRVKATLDMRLSKANGSTWVFPAQTKSGHIESSSLKKQHRKAIAEGTRILREETRRIDVQLAPFELYTLRHTCLTRWAPHMAPWTLAYLAGHRDMNITKRYVHPQEQTIRAAMEKAQVETSGHTSEHTGQKPDLENMPVLAPSN